MQVLAFTAGSLGDILATAGLAAQVVKVLYDNRNLAKECETLAIELQSLQSVLIMVEFALQRYGSTPLGEPLVHFIRPEVAQCHLSLKAFSDKVVTCQQSLSLTTMGSLWRKVIWAASDEAASLSAKLSNHRLKLVTLLITINSVGWMDSGVSCLIPGQMFTQHGPPMRSIKDNTIDVVDPLGETIPVPILFCGTWEAFDHVLKGFSRNRVGQHYIDQGDYQIVKPNDNKIVSRSELCKVKEGDTVEMSIILRPNRGDNENRRRCPRCSYLNNHILSDSGWVKCLHCSGLFHANNVWVKNPSRDKILDGNHPDDESLDMKSTLAPLQEFQHDPESDAKFFRRITLEIQVMLITTIPSQTSSRQTLTRSLELAREAVRIDSTNGSPEDAIQTYIQSIALLNDVIGMVMNGENSTKALRGRRNKSAAAQEEEVMRLQNIRNTYADRVDVLKTVYNVPDWVGKDGETL
ncbi:hypothetical protein GALMADRAFT_228816 [Galerina marginata CBS 339.88]|uniref:Ubiquitin-like domain-containing protein n=1 Tax=Galerina marginata (strain CBS 339.88) TaxID=685588 RepID=A0A067SXX5_GALM3|nr:hypothetical protein GALMADRAFT_228816 [Galerina marginata CBS 339.88]